MYALIDLKTWSEIVIKIDFVQADSFLTTLAWITILLHVLISNADY
jgi:hypothetical protein